ncbi:MAG: hypothetical protein F2732_06610 [Actinobacteria bacterium]|uniref:Unannotated protein n=1 Tax=freshwater metagenome TaxID=449393 RepID=A0A6J6XXK9_9ZZZZ|nr:hypothetical protein [Actinomycetota bacterium]
MKFRRPRNSTLVSIVVFLISFGFWLGQPQAEKPYSQIPDVSWVFVTTTTPAPIDTTPVVVETTLPPETTIPVDTVPTETTLDPAVTTVAP